MHIRCAGQGPIGGYAAPTCPKSNCGKCYKVTNRGGIGSSINGEGKSILVQIIDSCPASSAYNFCKTNMPASQRCGDTGTNQLDIDQSAYVCSIRVFYFPSRINSVSRTGVGVLVETSTELTLVPYPLR